MGAKILVVDDSATVRQQVSLALKQAGFETIEANDGQDGYETAANDSSIKLVICDVNMPRMNGIEMVQKLSAEGYLEKFTVVMLTTEGDPSMISKAKAAGAKGWIVKPFKANLLVAAAQKLTQAA